jgi:hypothetical protein
VRAGYDGLLLTSDLWHFYQPIKNQRLDDRGLAILPRDRHQARPVNKARIVVYRKDPFQTMTLPRHEIDPKDRLGQSPHSLG